MLFAFILFPCFATAVLGLPSFKGERSFLLHGRHHRIRYDVQQAVDNQNIIDLNNITGMGTVNTSCNLDMSHIVIQFEQPALAQAFANYVPPKNRGNDYYTRKKFDNHDHRVAY